MSTAPDTRTLPFGAWPSPLSAQQLVAGRPRLSEVWVDGGFTYWAEERPEEGGRVQIVRRDRDGSFHDVLPAGFWARTAVHEYGGAAWWVQQGVVFFANWSDQRLYRIEGKTSSATPIAITPEPQSVRGFRYADGRVTPDGQWILCVREWHPVGGGEAHNDIVALPADGSRRPTVIATGRDFVSAPRISPDGRMVCWLTWDHPNMPWDDTELWVGRLQIVEGQIEIAEPHRVAGKPGESLVQPEWGHHGQLYVCSDRSDWWNVYLVAGIDDLQPLCPINAEVGGPAWAFGQSRYGFAEDRSLICSYSVGGVAHLARVGSQGDRADRALPLLSLSSLRIDGDHVVALATSATSDAQVVRIALLHGPIEVVRPAAEGLSNEWISVAEPIAFPSEAGQAHGLFYKPKNPHVVGPEGQLPPLLVFSHGGPTAAASSAYNPSVQFWTSRGFAVVDVDYGGSTGYGRSYRQRLVGNWGIVDVDDCCAAATYLADAGLVDRSRLAIRGGSAGGFTTLAALAFRDRFHAGVNYFGVSDLAALARDTHKFEARYLDSLVGAYPEEAALYEARSPLFHLDGLSCPVLVLQGLQDRVVPPAQSEAVVEALAAKGVPHAYLAFAGEQHGFRLAETIVVAQNAELSFYAQVFGFEPAGDVPRLALVTQAGSEGRPGS